MIYSRPTALTADRSRPRKSIVMIIHPDEMARVPEPALPDGYAFRTYLPGDEKNWARITTIVDEFSCEQNAENAFRKQFMQDEDALRKRLSFVIAPDGNAIATSMAWNFDENGRHFGRVHWICTDPAHQGKGVGRAIVAWAIRRISELDPAVDTYLDTQTWSHKAIGLYLRMGFHPVRESHPILTRVNEYSGAVEVLKGVLPDETMRQFIDRSEA